MWNGTDRHRGFTLAEVLVALAVFALMGAFLFGFAVRLEEEGERLAGIYRQISQLQSLWDGLRRDLGERVRVSFSGLQGGVRGDEGELSLVIAKGYRVTYRLEGTRLVRRATPVEGGAQQGWRVMVEGVRSLRFTYLEKGKWFPRWIGRRIPPEAIRFELAMDGGIWHSALRL